MPIVIINTFRIKPFWFVLCSLPFLFIAIMYDTMVLEYDSYVNISVWNTLINSNPAEASEFSSEMSLTTLLLIGAQISTYIIYLVFSYKKSLVLISKPTRIINALILFGLIVDFLVRGATSNAFPLRSIRSLNDYYKVKKQEAKYFEIKKNAQYNATRNDEYSTTTKETIVVVVGETLRRDHLEYYGYQKKTTPLMKKENLILFKDVISAANQTVNSLQRVFTLAETLDENDYWKYPSFIKSFKEVGFKTYWISTQLVYDRAINEVSFIAKECDSVINYNMESFDERILEPYQKVLEIKDQKKIIFLHILGNHSKYNKRYPNSFKYFSKEKSNDKRINLLREYDDAVRYNDYILSELLNKLKKQNGENTFIMFSDHGESLYDSNPKHCYHGSDKPAKSEFEVPFVLWFSDVFKENHLSLVAQININKEKSIILSDFFHALPSLFGIEFNKLKKENNFFGKTYKTKLRRKVVYYTEIG